MLLSQLVVDCESSSGVRAIDVERVNVRLHETRHRRETRSDAAGSRTCLGTPPEVEPHAESGRLRGARQHGPRASPLSSMTSSRVGASSFSRAARMRLTRSAVMWGLRQALRGRPPAVCWRMIQKKLRERERKRARQ